VNEHFSPSTSCSPDHQPICLDAHGADAPTVGDVSSVHLLAIEQAMRVSADEAAVLRIAAASSHEARTAALGTLLSTCSFELVPGCPLLAWCEAGRVAVNWRRFYEPVDGSLYATLELLRLLSADLDTSDAATLLDELDLRRCLVADTLF